MREEAIADWAHILVVFLEMLEILLLTVSVEILDVSSHIRSCSELFLALRALDFLLICFNYWRLLIINGLNNFIDRGHRDLSVVGRHHWSLALFYICLSWFFDIRQDGWSGL